MQIQDLESELIPNVSNEFQHKQIVYLEKELRYSPRSESLHSQLGQLHFETNNRGKAEHHFRQVLLATGHDPAAHAGLAALYKQAGNHQLATYHFQKACEMEPDLRSDILTRFFDSNSH